MTALLLRIALVAGVVAAVYGSFIALRDAYIKQGYDAAVLEYQINNAEVGRLAQAVWARKNEELANLQEKYRATTVDLQTVRSRVRDAERLRAAAEADFAARLAAASADSVRRYATQARDDILRCRADVERFGFEAAAASAAAHTLSEALSICIANQ